MNIILSPAKNMLIRKFENQKFEEPIFKEETLNIHSVIKNFQPYEIESLMKVNPKIALKAFCDFSDFNIEEGGHALLSYDGLVFKNINPMDFSEKDIKFAQQHLKILSGFYGILTPLTKIYPYRLEMGLKISIEDKKDLYKFWDNKIYKKITENKTTIINLASKEYKKAIIPFIKDTDTLIDIDFLIAKYGKHKTIVTSAKMARGQMVRYIIKNKIDNIEGLKEFYFDGYTYNPYLSNEEKMVFLKNS